MLSTSALGRVLGAGVGWTGSRRYFRGWGSIDPARCGGRGGMLGFPGSRGDWAGPPGVRRVGREGWDAIGGAADAAHGVKGVLGGIAVAVLLLALGVCLPASRLETDLVQAPVDRSSPQTGPDAGTRDPRTPPNILFILTDDQDVASVSEMPNVRSLLAAEGTSFERAFVTTALCCPSRSSILRGQYAHNHGIWTTREPDGGFRRFEELGLGESTIATWLDGAGYHTGYMGKYLNEYGSFDEPIKHVPPGWDRWVGYEGGPQEQLRNGSFKVNDQGEAERLDTGAVHDTDYLAR